MDTKHLEIEELSSFGWSRYSQFKKFLPFSKETFRKLVLDKKAPQPTRMGARCTFYSNSELHKFLADPLNYRVGGL